MRQPPFWSVYRHVAEYLSWSVSAIAPLHLATSKTWVSTLEFHRHPTPLRSYNYFRSGKGQFPFPVSYQCRAVSAVAPLDSATPKTWVSTLEFHRYHIPVRSYNCGGLFPLPVSYQHRTVSWTCPLRSGTQIMWTWALEYCGYLNWFHSCILLFIRYKYFRFSSRFPVDRSIMGCRYTHH